MWLPFCALSARRLSASSSEQRPKRLIRKGVAAITVLATARERVRRGGVPPLPSISNLGWCQTADLAANWSRAAGYLRANREGAPSRSQWSGVERRRDESEAFHQENVARLDVLLNPRETNQRNSGIRTTLTAFEALLST